MLNPEVGNKVPDPEVATQSGVWASASSVEVVPFTSAIPCSTACEPTGTAAGGGNGVGGTAGGSGGSMRTSSSKAGAYAARETGFVGVAAVAVFGGAMVLI